VPRPSRARLSPRGRLQARFKVWVVFDGRVKFGDGRADLLALVDELGSLKKAVGRIGMSYRNAWGYLRELEDAAGFKLLERTPGGGPEGGTQLTAKGRLFLARYRRFRQGLDEVVQQYFERSFGRR
jgi:molybdate transport system regulatory protein